MASLIILIFQYLVFLFVRKILEFILPLPFFPAVSSILAKAVGLDPLAFQPIYTRLALPKLSLPHIPNISIIPASQRHFPFEPRIPLIKDFKVPGIPMLHSTKDDATIPLGEKVHTWRQNQLLANAQPERGIMSMDDFANKNLKPTIDKIDFGVSEIEKDVAAVVPHLAMPEPIVAVEHGAERILRDHDYARQSSEKQIYENAEKQAVSMTSQEVHPATSPKKPQPVATVEPVKPPSEVSPASSVYLAPQSGEVSTVPAPRPVNPINTALDILHHPPATAGDIERFPSVQAMHIMGPLTRARPPRQTGGVGHWWESGRPTTN